MSTRARWTHDATDYTTDLGTAAKMINIASLSASTGLSQRTLEDLITRDPITREDNPLIALCRPAGRIGSIPLWSRGQLDNYRDRTAFTEGKEKIQDLPSLFVEEAEQRGLITTGQFAEAIGVHDQTLRRWARVDARYPEVLAKLARPNVPGNPEHLYDLVDYVRWARERGWSVPGSVLSRAEEIEHERHIATMREAAESDRMAVAAEQGD